EPATGGAIAQPESVMSMAGVLSYGCSQSLDMHTSPPLWNYCQHTSAAVMASNVATCCGKMPPASRTVWSVTDTGTPSVFQSWHSVLPVAVIHPAGATMPAARMSLTYWELPAAGTAGDGWTTTGAGAGLLAARLAALTAFSALRLAAA